MTRMPSASSFAQVLEQREWHMLLAEQDLSAPPAPEPIEFRYWRWQGHLVRYAVSRPSPDGTADPSLPSLVLVHGFGASSDQWSKCFTELAGQYRIFAIDLLGFGHSEKPPVTFTQYLWQDQASGRRTHTLMGPHPP